jgi:hypothetical protein
MAPYWAFGLFVFLLMGLSTTWFDWGNFWNGYALDMAGPAWNYILFRGLFVAKADNRWTRFFTPKMTFGIFATACICFETIQYLELYDSTFDPLDFVAYGSILVLFFLLDLSQSR